MLASVMGMEYVKKRHIIIKKAKNVYGIRILNNEFEKQLEEIKEWQRNALNPGYYVGTGRVASPIKNLNKYPIFLILLGGLVFIPSFIGFIELVQDFFRSISSAVGMLYDVLMLAVGFLLLKAGIKGTFNKYINKKSRNTK